MANNMTSKVEEMAAQGYSVDFIVGYFKGFYGNDSQEIEDKVYDIYESYMDNCVL